MRYLVRILCVFALSIFPLVGCGTTPPTSAGPCESAADCSDRSDCTEDVCTDGECSYVPLENGTACNDGLCMDGRCAPLALVSAGVYSPHPAGEEWWPVMGATVSVYGTSISATTDEDGWAELVAPVGTVFLHASAEGAWGSVQLVEVSQDGTTYADFELLDDAYLRPMEEALGIKLDETRGIVAAWYYYTSSGGETLKLSEPYGVALTLDSDDNWLLSAQLQPGVFEPFLLFVGVDVTDALTVKPIAPEGKDCRLQHCTIDPGGFERCETLDPEIVFPVVAKSFTSFGVECTWL